MNVLALRLPVVVPALPLIEERTALSPEWQQQGMPRDRIVYVGYEATRHTRSYGADGRALRERGVLGNAIDIYV
jgi:hypothetical protein